MFNPSIGVEFVTKMGVNVPEFVESAIELHTSMYHESALHAKITMENNEVKLSIPAPERTTRLFSMWYERQFFIPASFLTKLVCNRIMLRDINSFCSLLLFTQEPSDDGRCWKDS